MSSVQYIQDSLALRIDDPVSSVVITPRTPGHRRFKRQLHDARTHGAPDLKVCRDCGLIKSASEFHRYASNRDGLAHYCKSCARERSRAQWKKYDRKTARHQAQWKKRIQQLYGLTVEQYTARAEAQNNQCPICGASPPRLVVDHDHETGALRDLLCKSCNIALGYMRDSPAALRAAAEYLERHGK